MDVFSRHLGRSIAGPAGGQVIVLASHPTWISGQRYAAERLAAMSRHPSSSAMRRAQGEIGGSRR